MPSERLRFRLLGPLQMTIDGIEQGLGGPRQRAVLAMLVINRRRAVSVDALAQAAWGEELPSDIRAGMQVVISNLRKMLRDAGIDPRAVLATVAPGYRLTIDDQSCDLGRFLTEKTLGLRSMADHRFGEATEHFTAALNEWNGPALADLRELSFAEYFATALEEERLIAFTARAEAEIARGRAPEITPELMTLAAEHPLREPLWCQLISALYLCGRQSDALGACRQLRSALADELGIDPSRQMQDLEGRILRQEPLPAKAAAAATAPVAVTIIDERSPSATAQLRDDSGKVIPIGATAMCIGRLPDNDVVLSHGKVSRHHAIIVDTGLNFVIRDLRSSNGVFVRGERIIDSAVLADGDGIRIGTSAFVFELVPHGSRRHD
jgi:DNA-binding SARP family transcriptional activator